MREARRKGHCNSGPFQSKRNYSAADFLVHEGVETTSTASIQSHNEIVIIDGLSCEYGFPDVEAVPAISISKFTAAWGRAIKRASIEREMGAKKK